MLDGSCHAGEMALRFKRSPRYGRLNSMATILNWIYVAGAVVLLFGAAIFVHEFGHFWVARKRGLKVEAFAIGMGPKIFGWVRDGIEYSVRWIPAGGFVRLPQMITSAGLEGANDPKEAPLPPISPLSKILVAIAGPFMNVVFAFAIATVIYFAGLPVQVNPSVIGYVEVNSAEQKLGIKEGDTIVEVNGKKVKSWQEVHMQTIFARTNVLPVVIERAGARQTYMLTAVPNDLMGKMLNLDPKGHPVISQLEAGLPAERAGLKAEDRFLSFGGVPIYSQEQLVDLIRKSAGKPKEVTVERAGKRIALTVTPLFDPDLKRGRIGVALTSSSVSFVVERPGPTPWAQIEEVLEQMAATIGALTHSKQTGVGAKDLSGPVGILTVLAMQVNTDYRLALKFLVLLNINLAILNLLPIPVLDGGHIAMAVLERIRRRPLSPKLIEYVNTGFAVLLISFMAYVTFFDVRRFSPLRPLFQRDTQIENVTERAPAPTGGTNQSK